MRRAASRAGLAFLLALPLTAAPAFAQDATGEPPPAEPPAAEPPAEKAAEPPAAEPPAEKAAEPPAAEPPGEKPAEPPGSEAKPPEGNEAVTPSEKAAQAPEGPTAGWRDIVVVPRRPVLKRRRLEIMPTYNVGLSSPMMRAHGFGGQLNFYLSEAFFIGLEGTYYLNQQLDRYYLIGLDQRVLPSVNRYVWSAFLEFGYVPIHGKFTLFNSAILHWDTYISAGVGLFQSEIIPRDPADAPFSNYLISGLLPGFGTRLWVNRWLAIDAYLKDYIFVDQLEPKTRAKGDCTPGATFSRPDSCKVDSQLTFNFVFGVGLSIFLPPGFEYKTPR